MLRTLFYEKLTKSRILKQSHSAEKCNRGYLLDFLSSSWLQKIEITKEWTFLRHQKISEKTMPKKTTKIKSELSNNEKSFKNYGTQEWHPWEAPEIAH